MITDGYKASIQKLHHRGDLLGHSAKTGWGATSARNFGDEITKFMNGKTRVTSLLDFGSGQGSMQLWLNEYLTPKVRAAVKIFEYDPGVDDNHINLDGSQVNQLPKRQFDMIISSDVLEHVEPEMIDETITWMQEHTNKFLYHHIACDPAGLKLDDGRNVHLITEDLSWWMEKFTHADWQWMEARDCWQQKRGKFRRHCHIRLDKVPGAKPISYVSHD